MVAKLLVELLLGRRDLERLWRLESLVSPGPSGGCRAPPSHLGTS